ncbi:MAG: ComF family protein [Acidobacteriota bacterium]|jgi:ComF family protein|nr:ComF family protein [Acidobacteriota bacterium]
MDGGILNPYFPTVRDAQASAWRNVLDGFLNLVYPEACFVCATPTDRRQDCGVCDDCWGKILGLHLEGPICPSCGTPLPGFALGSTSLCLECVRQAPPYSGARSFGYYSMEMRRLVHELKFEGRRSLAELAAPLLARAFFDSWRREDFDAVTAVPLHPSRRRERGYNQSKLLARELARKVAIPEVEALKRVTATRPQVGLTDAQRQENVRKAFRCARPEAVAGKRLLLVDDVMTTGATVSCAAQALLDAGAERVSVLTVARAIR